MNDEIRLVKFETLIKDVQEAFSAGRVLGSFFGVMIRGEAANRDCKNISMMLIYDYDKLNSYGKIIIKNSFIRINDWNIKYSKENLKDSKVKIDAAKDLIKYCRMEEYRKAALEFIFWAMMVLTVEKSDFEDRLSLVCDFAQMLKITDDEMMDILQVIKIVYQHDNCGEGTIFNEGQRALIRLRNQNFKTSTVKGHFNSVIELYK